MIGVYIHIPFCRTLCPYCDFIKRPLEGAIPDAFIDALCGEVEAFEGPDAVGSIFFGGGTPSLLSPDQLERIFDQLQRRFRFGTEPDPCEITVEANPDDVSEALVRGWKTAGVNRVSLGVQSFDDDVLAYLGRRHGADGARHACDTVAQVFENWNMDLIYGARPVEAWTMTLDECRRFASPHVSAYSLTYEERTPFYTRRHEAVDDETALQLMNGAAARLDHVKRYEVSNFARAGYESRHNLIYWHNEEYAGFGPGAYSFVNGVRARNLLQVDSYLANPGAKKEAFSLTDREIRVETLIQHLRLAEGLKKQVYESRFGTQVEVDFAHELSALEHRGLLEQNNGSIRPTAKGFELNNEIGLTLVG